jgi:hypothetical protein
VHNETLRINQKKLSVDAINTFCPNVFSGGPNHLNVYSLRYCGDIFSAEFIRNTVERCEGKTLTGTWVERETERRI